MRWSALFITLLLGLSVQAKVFTLRTGVTPSSMKKMLALTNVTKDPIIINGEKGMLESGITDRGFDDVLHDIKVLLKDFNRRQIGNSLLIEFPREDGSLFRQYIISMGGQYKTVCFSLEVSKKALNAKPDWPSELPAPTGATIENVMIMSKREVIHGTFTVDSRGESAHRDYDNKLQADGWRPVSVSGRGGLYMQDDYKRLLMFSVSDDGSQSRASVYMKRTRD